MYRGIDVSGLDAAALMRLVDNPPADVYFIRCEQYVKIGASKWPPGRLKQIRHHGGGSSFPPLMNYATSELLATEIGGFTREKALHARFSHLRHTGEWFTEAPELTDYINALDQGVAA